MYNKENVHEGGLFPAEDRSAQWAVKFYSYSLERSFETVKNVASCEMLRRGASFSREFASAGAPDDEGASTVTTSRLRRGSTHLPDRSFHSAYGISSRNKWEKNFAPWAILPIFTALPSAPAKILRRFNSAIKRYRFCISLPGPWICLLKWNITFTVIYSTMSKMEIPLRKRVLRASLCVVWEIEWKFYLRGTAMRKKGELQQIRNITGGIFFIALLSLCNLCISVYMFKFVSTFFSYCCNKKCTADFHCFWDYVFL